MTGEPLERVLRQRELASALARVRELENMRVAAAAEAMRLSDELRREQQREQENAA